MKDSVVLWLGDFPDQNALACKLSDRFDVTGIVYERRPRYSMKKYSFLRIISKIAEKLFLHEVDRAWFNMFKYYMDKFPPATGKPFIEVENINSEDTFKFTISKSPALIMVSGTSLVKENLMAIKPEIGIINLHTGLSPYIKGGPNCTNWCISTEQYHLIGNTVMWLDNGIDSGNILASRTVNFSGEENLSEIHIKVIEEAHTLYLETADNLLRGKSVVNAISQESIGAGKTYFNKSWGFKEKLRLIRNMKKFQTAVRSDDFKLKRKKLVLVDLPGSRKS